MSRYLTPDQAADARARGQHGAINHEQAVAAGLTDQQIKDRMRSGRWRHAVRGVYVVAGAPDTWQQRAWIAYLATRQAGGVLSYNTAGAVLGVMRASPLPHTTVPPTASIRCKGARVHRSVVRPEDRQWSNGLRITTPSRLIVDVAGIWARPQMELLTDNVICKGLASPASILAAADRVGRGRRGVGLVRALIDVWTEAIEPGSPAEMRLVRRLGELGLTGLVSQHDVFDADGSFVGRLDLADPTRKRGFEYDGVLPHGPRAWARDEPRYARFAGLGWDVDTVTKADLVPGATRLDDIVARWNRSSAA